MGACACSCRFLVCLLGTCPRRRTATPTSHSTSPARRRLPRTSASGRTEFVGLLIVRETASWLRLALPCCVSFLGGSGRGSVVGPLSCTRRPWRSSLGFQHALHVPPPNSSHSGPFQPSPLRSFYSLHLHSSVSLHCTHPQSPASHADVRSGDAQVLATCGGDLPGACVQTQRLLLLLLLRLLVLLLCGDDRRRQCSRLTLCDAAL